MFMIPLCKETCSENFLALSNIQYLFCDLNMKIAVQVIFMNANSIRILLLRSYILPVNRAQKFMSIKV